MAVSLTVANVLDGTIQSVKAVIPLSMEALTPTLVKQPYNHSSLGVLIGMTGDIRGRFIIEGLKETIGRIGEAMFGIPVEGEMLESFAAEPGNMIAGNLAAILATNNLEMDITPPTVLIGQTKIYGFDKALNLPIQIASIGSLNILLMIDMP
ncbi:chemotaxis protein CheX [Peribacillus glennii]|uniref:Chemotaxis protein CheX n=1 Tax=Peribacillus glennii TaxID=2303991 RepID=A0A372LHD9_9BACI|nr:chemotaxis protein CheX [Peribacillus glennii]RFU65489.1 chemotaxis protein CheX [Peribacillus glennii]